MGRALRAHEHRLCSGEKGEAGSRANLGVGQRRHVAGQRAVPLLADLHNQHFGQPPRPLLVSLDLGFNDLTDLQSMILGLSTLKCLRLLVLQGNPLALVPYYRGFTVDSLARLCVLDDITVSPSEKHQFRGLNSHGGRVQSHIPASTLPTSP